MALPKPRAKNAARLCAVLIVLGIGLAILDVWITSNHVNAWGDPQSCSVQSRGEPSEGEAKGIFQEKVTLRCPDGYTKVTNVVYRGQVPVRKTNVWFNQVTRERFIPGEYIGSELKGGRPDVWSRWSLAALVCLVAAIAVWRVTKPKDRSGG